MGTALLEALLTLIDWLCAGIAGVTSLLFCGVVKGLGLLLRALGALGMLAARALLWPLGWLGRRLTAHRRCASQCLKLDGEEFEQYVALILKDNGFKHVEVTSYSGDQGVDILAERGGKEYAIQCKNYVGAVGNAAVQEAFAGAQHYGCDIAVVVCPGAFTRAAQELAQSTGVKLWGEEKLSHMMRVSGRKPRSRKK